MFLGVPIENSPACLTILAVLLPGVTKVQRSLQNGGTVAQRKIHPDQMF
jgi:hypothetical protein